jgi:hypothetical protein
LSKGFVENLGVKDKKLLEENGLRNENKIISETGAGFLFIFKARKQAHSRLYNCLRNAEDEQKDKSVSDVIESSLLSPCRELFCRISRPDFFTKP